MKLFNHSLKGLQTEDGLKVANEEEVIGYLYEGGAKNSGLYKLKPDTFYEILGATHEWEWVNPCIPAGKCLKEKGGLNCNQYNSRSCASRYLTAIIHLPKENNPESSANSFEPIKEPTGTIIIEAVKRGEIKEHKGLDGSYFHYKDVVNLLNKQEKELESLRTANRELVKGIKKIKNLSKYDRNHDNILYNYQDIHNLSTELIQKYEKPL